MLASALIASASATAQDILDLAPLVVLAPRCGLRPADWGQRLDIALNDAAAITGSDSLTLAKIELSTAEGWSAAPKAVCKKLKSDHTLHRRLTSADQMLHAR